MSKRLKCAAIVLGLYLSSTVNAIPIGDFPGLSKLIDMADAIVILRVECRLSDYNVPPYYSIHECMVYQSLKGDIPAYETSNSRIHLRFIDPEFNFATPFAHGSSHLMFLSKRTAETGHEEGYYTLDMKGAYVPLSPIGNEKIPQGDTLEEKIRNVIKGAIEYENQQHEKKQAFLKKMLGHQKESKESCPIGKKDVVTGNITGKVVDRAGKGVCGASVFICEQKSGIPLSPNTLKPLRLGELAPLYAITDDAGTFSFDTLPVGQYRFVSQSWKDVKDIKDAMEVNGKKIQLNGIADNVQISEGISPDIMLCPLGTGILKIDADMPNDDTLLVISTSPTQADPILGFSGWVGEFMWNMIGFNRMPSGQTTIYGLPEGDVYFAMFQNDDSPGWVDGQVTIRPNEMKVLNNIQFVAGWSDGRHDPPKELLQVFDEIKPLVLSKNEFLFDLFKEYGLMDIPPEKRLWGFMEAVIPNLQKEVELPSGRTATFGQIVAAWKYVEFQQRIEYRDKLRGGK